MYIIRLFFPLLLFWSSLASAEILNVEFKFTPFTGDLKTDQVETVVGKARVFINNVLLTEQEVRQESAPVLFEEREIAASVWLPVASLGPQLRKGKNSVRIEFRPADTQAPYSAQFSWASVTDQVTEERSAGAGSSTNQQNAGMENEQASGNISFEHEFVADFAADLPWHHYPPVTSLSDDDKRQLADLLASRAAVFKPGFDGIYSLLETQPNIDTAAIKSSRCLDAAYAAGVRIKSPAPDELEFMLTGNPEVLVSAKGDRLYTLSDPAALAKIKGDEAQACVEMALFVAYPPHLALAHTPAGEWKVVY